jgi:FMN phosphatase YigB (HAD superfamily)
VRGDTKSRLKKLDDENLRDCFELITFFDGTRDEPKDIHYQRALKYLGLPAANVIFVDDRITKLAWAIAHGGRTIWIRQGEFQDELPTDITGMPTLVIDSIGDLMFYL